MSRSNKPRIPVKIKGPRHTYDFVESMTRFVVRQDQVFGTTPKDEKEEVTFVRVWREENEVRSSYDETNEDLLAVVRKFDPFARKEIAEALANMPRVTAVEVTDEHGCGVVIYSEWP